MVPRSMDRAKSALSSTYIFFKGRRPFSMRPLRDAGQNPKDKTLRRNLMEMVKLASFVIYHYRVKMVIVAAFWLAIIIFALM